MSLRTYDKDGTDVISLTMGRGRRIDLRRLKPGDVRIEDIALSLSNICRFTGHVRPFYSVAQHSLLVSWYLAKWDDPWLQLQGLLHDAAEAYINDLSHYLKHAPELAGYRQIEMLVEPAIWGEFNLPAAGLDPRVKEADHVLTDREWGEMAIQDRPRTIVPFVPELAESSFLNEFDVLRKQIAERRTA